MSKLMCARDSGSHGERATELRDAAWSGEQRLLLAMVEPMAEHGDRACLPRAATARRHVPQLGLLCFVVES